MESPLTVTLVSLGCAKNTVDGEVLLGVLAEAGFQLTDDPDEADAVLVNTCCFIEPATLETTDYIRYFEGKRKDGSLKTLIVTGCLPQRYRKQNLSHKFPWVDAFLGPGDVPAIASVLRQCLANERVARISVRPTWLYDHRSPRVRITPPHTAYVKIAEGCSHPCAFCLIPMLRGRFRSRRMRSVIEEVRGFSQDGPLREINLVAQDTTSYGRDLYGEPRLAMLLKRLAKEASLSWIRLLYADPRSLHRDVIEVIANEDAVCDYIDLPLQHCNDRILRRMRRGMTKKSICKLIDRIRSSIPGVTLRTTLMVGFPGETEREFQELVDFVVEQKFERMGVFAFSPEEGVPASRFPDQVPDEIKEERQEVLMLLQQVISQERNKTRVGERLDVLVDGVHEDEPTTLVGRTEGDAPEVDGVVLLPSGKTRPGEFVRVRITGANEYDLVGEEIKPE